MLSLIVSPRFQSITGGGATMQLLLERLRSPMLFDGYTYFLCVMTGPFYHLRVLLLAEPSPWFCSLLILSGQSSLGKFLLKSVPVMRDMSRIVARFVVNV